MPLTDLSLPHRKPGVPRRPVDTVEAHLGVTRYASQAYEISGLPGDIIARLDEFAKSDTWGSKGACSGCLISTLGLTIGAVTLWRVPTGAIPVPVLAACASAIVAGLIVFYRYAPFDLENHRYAMPRELLTDLSPLLDPAHPVTLKIDFRKSSGFGLTTREEQGKGWLSRPTTIAEFTHPWLELQAKARDGQSVTLRMLKFGEIRRIPTGKTHRTEEDYQESVTVTLRDPARDRPLPAHLPFSRGEAWSKGSSCEVDGALVIDAFGKRSLSSYAANLKAEDVLALINQGLQLLTPRHP